MYTNGTIQPLFQIALADFPTVVINETAVKAIQQGRPVQGYCSNTDGLINLINGEGAFIGIGEASIDGRISPKRLMNTAR